MIAKYTLGCLDRKCNHEEKPQNVSVKRSFHSSINTKQTEPLEKRTETKETNTQPRVTAIFILNGKHKILTLVKKYPVPQTKKEK